MRCWGAPPLALVLCAVVVAGCVSSTGTGSPPAGAGFSPMSAGVGVPGVGIVAVTVSQTGDATGVATFQGGQDAAAVQWIEISVNSGPRVPIGSATTKVVARQSVALRGLTPGQDHVVAVGHFVDGHDQVVLDTYV